MGRLNCPSCGREALAGDEACEECGFPLAGRDVVDVSSGVGVDPDLLAPVTRLRVAPPAILSPMATARQAIDEMERRNVGAVLVADEDGALVGIFSVVDVLRRLDVAKFPDGRQPLWQIMTHNPATLTETATLAHAMHLMAAGGFRHCPIVRAGNKPVGLLTFLDVLSHLHAASPGATRTGHSTT